jgi:hypothetical protein
MYKDDEPLNRPENENCYIVYLNVFSGRPDPAWYLSNEDSFNFDTMLCNLPKTEKRHRGNLGYSGFSVDDGAITTTIVGGGVIEVIVGVLKEKEHEYYEDVDRKVEKWLVSKAREFEDMRDILDNFDGPKL